MKYIRTYENNIRKGDYAVVFLGIKDKLVIGIINMIEPVGYQGLIEVHTAFGKFWFRYREILFISSIKEECKIFIEANKYNL